MAGRIASWWQRLRNWWQARQARRLGLWERHELELAVNRWLAWRWPRLPGWGTRSWDCHTYHPAGLDAAEAAPLVVVLHGCHQKAVAFAEASGWTRAAQQRQWRLVCPEQRLGSNIWRCWNWFAPPAQAGHGEIDVVLAAVEAARQRFAVSGVVVVGLSAGAGMAALLAFHAAGQVDAVATVAGPPLVGVGSLQDPRQVMREGLSIEPEWVVAGLRRCAPLLVLHGQEDVTVTPRCAEQLAAQARRVLERAHGALVQTPEAHGWTARAGDRPVLALRLLPGMGHAWTGAPGGHDHVATQGPDLTALVCAFFESQLAWPRAAPTPRRPSPGHSPGISRETSNRAAKAGTK